MNSMNIQRFIAQTSRQAMAKARNAFGDSAMILSTRSTEEGFEVMAAAEESLASVAPTAPAAAQKPALSRVGQAPAAAAHSVEEDTEALSMSTLSFQDFVRERMLRKRREALGGDAAFAPGPVAAAQRMAAARAEAQQVPVQVPVQMPMQAPMQMPMQRAKLSPPAADNVPPPIRTRSMPEPSWDDAPVHRAPHLAEPRRAPAAPEPMEPRDSGVAVELSALKDMIEERFNTLAWLGTSKQSPIHANLMFKLIRSGYSPSMARAVLERIPAETGAPEAVRAVMDVLTRNLKVAAPGEGLSEEGGVLALIGATGVGKTTTAAKLAAQCVKQHGAASVGLITLDTYRVAGFEQLRAYGRMLGVVAHLAHDRAALKDLLNLLANKRLVIIDTAGLGQRDQRIQDMLDTLEVPQLKKTLVLNASSHGDTLYDVLNAFKAKTLHGVVLSKVDEAVKLGPALDAIIRHQVVLRGMAIGQRVPEDWQQPDAAALVRLSMGSQGKSAFDPQGSDMGFYFSQASASGIDLGASHV